MGLLKGFKVTGPTFFLPLTSFESQTFKEIFMKSLADYRYNKTEASETTQSKIYTLQNNLEKLQLIGFGFYQARFSSPWSVEQLDL